MKDSRGARVITWDEFYRDFRSHYISSSFVEEMREKFRRLKQGGNSVYKYKVEFHELARYALQDIPDQKSKIYQFRGGLKEDLQLALALHDPEEFDKFYNLALRAEAALLTQLSSRGFSSRSKGILRLSFVSQQMLLVTSVGRRVTMPTSALLSSVFRLLLHADLQAMLS